MPPQRPHRAPLERIQRHFGVAGQARVSPERGAATASEGGGPPATGFSALRGLRASGFAEGTGWGMRAPGAGGRGWADTWRVQAPAQAGTSPQPWGLRLPRPRPKGGTSGVGCGPGSGDGHGPQIGGALGWSAGLSAEWPGAGARQGLRPRPRGASPTLQLSEAPDVTVESAGHLLPLDQTAGEDGGGVPRDTPVQAGSGPLGPP